MGAKKNEALAGADLIADAAANPAPAPKVRKSRSKERDDDSSWPEDGEQWDSMAVPTDAPMVPLGTLDGTLFVLDFAGQLRGVTAECRNGEMQLLCGGDRWLRKVWPLYGPPDRATNKPTIKGFDHKKAQTALITSCAKLGIFNPAGRTRGRGAHEGPDGELLMHGGDEVWRSAWKYGGRMQRPVSHATGKIGKLIFPTAEALDPPADAAATVEVAEELLDLLREWRWTDPIMPELVLSWVVCALVGGALGWRPHLWVVGPSGAGKSTLQNEVIRKLVGDWGVSTEDASEAGLRQTLNQDTLAVMFDEFEPDENNALVMQKVLKLVRGSSSGSETVRGSADHKAAKFVAKSCFLFSSIQYVAMVSQDRNRMAIVQLSPIPKDKEKIRLPATLATWGPMLRRRWLEQWPRWRDTLAAYQHEMFRQGFSAREQDTYGTLLAASDMMLFNGTPDPINLSEESYRVQERVTLLAPILDRARGESEGSNERCKMHLGSYRLRDIGKDDQRMVSRWLGLATRDYINGFVQGSRAAEKLLQYGIRIVSPPDDETSESAGSVPKASEQPHHWHVAIAPKDFTGTAEIFHKTEWQNGIWIQSLAGLSGARSGKKCRFGGAGSARGVTVPITHFIDVDEEQRAASKQKDDEGRQ